ncbi:hypothetical protein FEM48_ZijujUnG0014200 [Ziziphus jujuba var. spinosa]|uniref:Uncharacterized protein n=1 Tax=Ziziphus jujuba var. spinosa TaxID=714518 RepID=A0A978U9Y1_ZIZJJ|nr:hypothetical protein FEM48_ZijujUnG0014200 [Ziziphus jujuba var. spinosa]
MDTIVTITLATEGECVVRYNALAASAWQHGNEGQGSREEKVIPYWLTLVSGLGTTYTCLGPDGFGKGCSKIPLQLPGRSYFVLLYGTTKLCDYAILGDGDRRREASVGTRVLSARCNKYAISKRPCEAASVDLSKPWLFPPIESSKTWNHIIGLNEKVVREGNKGNRGRSMQGRMEESEATKEGRQREVAQREGEMETDTARAFHCRISDTTFSFKGHNGTSEHVFRGLPSFNFRLRDSYLLGSPSDSVMEAANHASASARAFFPLNTCSMLKRRKRPHSGNGFGLYHQMVGSYMRFSQFHRMLVLDMVLNHKRKAWEGKLMGKAYLYTLLSAMERLMLWLNAYFSYGR